jgi:hypothetical protein
VVQERQLGGTTADVDEERAPIGEGDTTRHGKLDEPGLLDTLDRTALVAIAR